MYAILMLVLVSSVLFSGRTKCIYLPGNNATQARFY